MLINLSVENWMSFRDPVSFSMVASRERQHGDRIAKVAKYQTRVLPIAAIYGGNASGKTNFFKALDFVKRLVVTGTKVDNPIVFEPFLLDSTHIEKPTHFRLELLVDEIFYEFSFAVTRKAIVQEKLVRITSSREEILYERSEGRMVFAPSLNKDKKFLGFVFRGTRDNQLFLTNSVDQKIEVFRPVYNWIKNALVLVAPESKFRMFEAYPNDGDPLRNFINEILPKLDTGISRLGGEEIPFHLIPFPSEVESRIQASVKEGMTTTVHGPPPYQRLAVSRKDGELVAKKLVTFHSASDGTEMKFEFHQESDGTKRVIDLLPAFLEATVTKKVVFIDEVDGSLHPLLTRQLVEAYLAVCDAKSRSQLLITTHDVHLMDQRLLRRDEMWAAERDRDGNSKLFSFSEYKDVRYDKDIRKSYLQGRLGGIPRILLTPP